MVNSPYGDVDFRRAVFFFAASRWAAVDSRSLRSFSETIGGQLSGSPVCSSAIFRNNKNTIYVEYSRPSSRRTWAQFRALLTICADSLLIRSFFQRTSPEFFSHFEEFLASGENAIFVPVVFMPENPV